MASLVGNVVRLSYTTTVGTTPTDAGNVIVTLQLPDGTNAGPFTPARTGPGAYSYDYQPLVPGRFSAYWLSTGAAAGAYLDEFDVLPQWSSTVVNLQDAKAYLNIPPNSTKQDDELAGFLDGVTRVIENIVGPVARRTVTEWHTLAGRTFTLRQSPVISVQTISTYVGGVGTSYTVGDESTAAYAQVDQASGTVTLGAWWGQGGVAFNGPYYRGRYGYGPVQVVYTAGRTSVPGNIRQAALELVRHNWQSQTARPGSQDDMAGPTLGFFVPNRVRELLAPDMLPPVVA